MVELLGGGLLERDDLNALRVHPRHHVLDDGVLTGRVHRLQHHEQRVPVGRPQQLLRLGELRDPARERVLRPLLELGRGELGEQSAAGPAGIAGGKGRRLTWPDGELVAELGADVVHVLFLPDAER